METDEITLQINNNDKIKIMAIYRHFYYLKQILILKFIEQYTQFLFLSMMIVSPSSCGLTELKVSLCLNVISVSSV